MYLSYLQVRQTNNNLAELTDGPVSRSIEHQLNKKIVAIIGMFFWCNFIIVSPPMISKESVLTNALIDLFVVLISSMNITIYCAFDKKFRKEIKKMLCCCFVKSNKNETILSTLHS
jgi:hypothetical protein